eukprot:9769812-Alexandrium_andersonii.AAC.1
MLSTHKRREANPADYGFEVDVDVVSSGVRIAPSAQPIMKEKGKGKEQAGQEDEQGASKAESSSKQQDKVGGEGGAKKDQ